MGSSGRVSSVCPSVCSGVSGMVVADGGSTITTFGVDTVVAFVVVVSVSEVSAVVVSASDEASSDVVSTVETAVSVVVVVFAVVVVASVVEVAVAVAVVTGVVLGDGAPILEQPVNNIINAHTAEKNLFIITFLKTNSHTKSTFESLLIILKNRREVKFIKIPFISFSKMYIKLPVKL
jgi:hypothetical protein